MRRVTALASLTAVTLTLAACSSSPPVEPVPSPTPSPVTVEIGYSPERVALEIEGLFTLPECGEEWWSGHVAAGDISIQAHASYESVREEDGIFASIETSVSFSTEQESAQFFLAQDHGLIITRDDKVVLIMDQDASALHSHAARKGFADVKLGGIEYDNLASCELIGQWPYNGFESTWDELTEEQLKALQLETMEFIEQHRGVTPGTYAIYAWSPIVRGEQSAVARTLTDEGVYSLSYLELNIGRTELINDPELAQYCWAEDYDDGTDDTYISCDIPEDVLASALIRQVPEEYIVDAPAAIAISAPYIIVVP